MKIYVGEIELNFEVKGQGHPLIMLHGNGEDHTIFDVLSEVLKDHFKIYLIDSRNHGKSSQTGVYAYDVMAYDIVGFIEKLRIKDPYVFGFSDGGIMALFMAIAFPDLISKMIIAGANIHPNGLKAKVRREIENRYLETPNPLDEMMLTQPWLRWQDLRRITAKTMILAGENDVIQDRHTEGIHHNIPNSELLIMSKHTHDDYVVHADVLKDIVISFLKK